jgi:chromosome segregation ATPase
VLWLFFILSTFITSITILNMLIAIMGDTFGKVTEIKDQSALREKVRIIADFVFLVRVDKSLETKYIYSLNPKRAEDDLTIADITAQVKQMINESEKDIKKDLADKIEVVKNEINGVDDKVNGLVHKINSMEKQQSELLPQMFELLTKVANASKILDGNLDEEENATNRPGISFNDNKIATGKRRYQ